MRKISFVALSAMVAAAPAYAAFESRHDSARSAAMGHSFLAAMGDAPSIFSNAAGIAPLRASEVSFLYAKPFAGMDGVNLGQGHAALAVPTSFGSFGVGYAHFQAQGAMNEQTLALAYGVNIGPAQVGVTGKRLSHTYTPEGDELAAHDPVFQNGTSKAAFGLDAGAVVPLGPSLKGGVTVRNINRPSVGLVTEDRLNREVQTGLMLNLSGLGMRVTGDMLFRQTEREEAKQEAIPAFGLEKTFRNNGLALRLGANSLEYTAGMGFKLRSMSFDYALVFNKQLAGDSAGTHKLGMSYQFGKRAR